MRIILGIVLAIALIPLGYVLGMRVVLSLVFTIILVPLGYVLGFVVCYYLGDHGDVGSAYLAVLTVPLGVVLGAVTGVILAAKLVGPQ